MQSVIVSGLLAEFELPELARQALVIIEAQVKEYANETYEIRMGPRELPLVFTRHQVRVENVLKSDNVIVQPGQLISVDTMGGQTHTLSVTVDQEARLSPDENVVLFLSQDRPLKANSLLANQFTVFGGFQGKYSIIFRATDRLVRRADGDFQNLENFRRSIKQALNEDGISANSAV